MSVSGGLPTPPRRPRFRAAAALLVLCCGLPGAGAEDTSFLTPAPAQSIQVEQDASNAFEDVVGPEGGELIAEGEDGTVYTLHVPPQALPMPTKLSLTPLSRVHGLPFAGGLRAGVKLEPDGTFFFRPVTLNVKFSQAVDRASLAPFRFSGDGQQFGMTVLNPGPDELTFVLNHFSGYGLATSTEQERAAQLAKPALDAEDELARRIQKKIGEERQKEMLGKDKGPGEWPSDVLEELKEYARQVLEPLKNAAGESCSVANLYVQSVIGLERSKSMLGESTEGLPDLGGLLGLSPLGESIRQRCLKEEAEACLKNGGDLARLVDWKIGWERQRQLLGVDETAEDTAFNRAYADALERCGQYEITFDSGLQESGELSAWGGLVFAGPSKYRYDAFLQAKVPLKVKAQPEAFGVPTLPLGSAPLEYARFDSTSNGSVGVVIAETSSGGARGFSANCKTQPSGTRPGVLTAQVSLMFKEGPPRKQPLHVPALQRIIDRLPQVGLLRPPRVLDLANSRVWIDPGSPTELTSALCQHNTGETTREDHEDHHWLGQWGREQGEPSSENGHEGQWQLSGWEPASDGLMRYRAARRTSGEFGTLNWDVQITLKHTPQR